MPKEEEEEAGRHEGKRDCCHDSTTVTNDTSTIGTQPTTVNVDPVTGEKLFSTFVEVDEDFGGFNLTTVANHEEVLAGRYEPVPASWILLDCQSTCHIVKKRGAT